MFWHAAGLGVDLERHPGLAEHFGIVTVEAMKAGCVPIVFDQGGQPEIVQSESNGFLWKTVQELQSSTLAVAADPVRRSELAKQSRLRAECFSRQVFVDDFRRRLQAVL